MRGKTRFCFCGSALLSGQPRNSEVLRRSSPAVGSLPVLEHWRLPQVFLRRHLSTKTLRIFGDLLHIRLVRSNRFGNVSREPFHLLIRGSKLKIFCQFHGGSEGACCRPRLCGILGRRQHTVSIEQILGLVNHACIMPASCLHTNGVHRRTGGIRSGSCLLIRAFILSNNMRRQLLLEHWARWPICGASIRSAPSRLLKFNRLITRCLRESIPGLDNSEVLAKW